MTIYAPLAFSILFPIGITNPRLAVFIILCGDRVSRKTVVWAEFFIVLLEVVRVLSVVGSTMDFGIKEHVRRKLVALDQDVVADYWGLLPGNMKPT